jgi:hypothetical protein
MTRKRSSLILAALILSGGSFVQGGFAVLGGFAAAPSGLIVHEWGTFTSVVDETGLPLEWRPFGRPSDLPGFVYSVLDNGVDVGPATSPRALKPALRALVRLETPVVYFYGTAETDVSVRVSFPEGRLTEWYPRARRTPRGLSWEHVHVVPGSPAVLPDEGDQGRYYAARATDAVPLTVDGDGGPQQEKFLFYRGVGRIVPPAFVALRGEQGVTVSNYAGSAVSEVVLFENRGGRISYLVRSKKGAQVALRRDAAGGTMESLRSDLEALLVGHGLYEKEASAMLDTWGDAWFEDGLRVFYVVPQRVVDAALPLTIDPQPARTVRVLVARTEILTPENLAALEQQVHDVSDQDLSDAAARGRALERMGRFAEPGLRRLLGRMDAGPLRGRVERLLAGS